MIRSVEAVFNSMQPTRSRARLVLDEAAEVSLYAPIQDLSLTVCLRMVSRAEAQGGPLQTKEFPPKIANKSGIAIQDDCPRDAMKPNNLASEKSNNRLAGMGMAQGEEMSVFGQLINHHQNDRLALRSRQAINEIHGHCIPNLVRNLQGSK
ncbi:hypothetical protein KSP39_PZI012966 [Platanthera zijinensis]|uniref:Uncharacterized protein n=1 Tax=Platanthera zijinensis TaxID=2320716 RepID=A0AAP0G3Z1_9ASPA